MFLASFSLRSHSTRPGCRLFKGGTALCGAILIALTSLTAQAQSMTEPLLPEVVKALQSRLAAPNNAQRRPKLYWSKLRIFYASRQHNPVWIGADGPVAKATQLRWILANADREGLATDEIYPGAISALWESKEPGALAELELLLTDAFFRYSEKMQSGYRSPFADQAFNGITPRKPDPITRLQHVLDAEDFELALQELAPAKEEYKKLRTALASYREIQNNGGWPTLPDGPILSLGTHHRHNAILRQRLEAEGDLKTAPTQHPYLFDQAMKLAVMNFQLRHGLNIDGTVGADTRKIMNVPVSARIAQIRLNMERWRWLPKPNKQIYIMVNTAGFTLSLFNEDETRLKMKVITGSPKRPTPIAKGLLHTVVINPYWIVPRTIIIEDLLPRQKRDPTYFKTRGIRMFHHTTNGEEVDPATLDWSKVTKDYFPYVLRQDPGKRNPLGRIKFLFNNTYDVYLHDTPEQQLFSKDIRAFSSGCIRVHKPVRLASYLMEPLGGWSEENIAAAIESGQHLEIPIRDSIPVFLVYITTWVDDENRVYFRPDIYQWNPVSI